MNIYVMNVLFFGFSVFLISILILLKRGDEIGRRWFYFSIFVAIWALFYSFQINNDISNEFALAVARTNNAASAFIPAAWLYFICGFLNIERKKVFWCSWLVALILVASSPTDLFIPSVSPAKGFVHYMDPGPIYHLHTINFFVIVSYGFYLMIRAYWKETSKEKRREISSLFLATVFGFFGGSTAYALVYLRSGAMDLTLLLSTYPFIMAYVMIKHRVLDIEKIADAFQREKLAAIGTMTTSINHEIRNPLYIIRGMAESHLENLRQGIYRNPGEATEQSKEILAKTVEQIERATDIMKRLVLFAKQETRQEAQFEEIKLSEIVEEILPLIGHELELDKIELIKEIPADLPPLFADRRHVEQILFNLIVNACQAMKEGGGKIEVGAVQQNRHVNITVQDNGPGIPQDKLIKIFEPFYTTKESGTGLGLYITKQLVERNKGKVKVESGLNKGTCFSLSFPVGDKI